jgi:hypothetical protein
VVNPSCYDEGKGMSIKQGTKRASAKSLNGGNSGPYVVPEIAIRDFIGSLSIGDVETTAARLQIVADATHREIDSQVDRLDYSHMLLLRSLVSESTNKDYRRIMRAIIAGVEQGSQGIDAAHLTASYAVELAFRWTPDYVSSLKQYGDKLRTRGCPQSWQQKAANRHRRCFQRVMEG